MARPRASDYDDKRRAILRRAASLIAERGYAGASLSLIAAACEFSKSLTYHYYSDKETLLFDIISCHLDGLVEVVDEAASSERPPRERLEAMAVALLDAYRDHDAEHEVQLSSLKLLPADRQEVLKDIERRLVRTFAAAIAAALPAGEEALLKPLTMSLFGMLNWHYHWFREGGEMTRADYARLACTLVVDGSAGSVPRGSFSRSREKVAPRSGVG